VVCIGSAALDLLLEVESLPPEDGRVAATDGLLAGGGPAATASVTLSRLGAVTELIARVGEDLAGDLIVAQLEAEGVGLRWTERRPDRRSALSSGVIRGGGSATRTLVALPASGNVLPLPDGALEACRQARWIHVDQAGWPVVPWLRDRGVRTPVSVDGGNPIDGLDLRLVDLYVPSASELWRWTGARGEDEAMTMARRMGARAIVATRGGDGAVYRGSCDPDQPWPDAFPDGPGDWCLEVGAWQLAALRSTLGAGDVYHGALLAALVSGRPLREAMVFAAVAAGLSCRALDGRSAIPDPAEVAAALADRPLDTEPAWRIDD
jgi:sulfofructose kinase